MNITEIIKILAKASSYQEKIAFLRVIWETKKENENTVHSFLAEKSEDGTTFLSLLEQLDAGDLVKEVTAITAAKFASLKEPEVEQKIRELHAAVIKREKIKGKFSELISIALKKPEYTDIVIDGLLNNTFAVPLPGYENVFSPNKEHKENIDIIRLIVFRGNKTLLDEIAKLKNNSRAIKKIFSYRHLFKGEMNYSEYIYDRGGLLHFAATYATAETFSNLLEIAGDSAAEFLKETVTVYNRPVTILHRLALNVETLECAHKVFTILDYETIVQFAGLTFYSSSPMPMGATYDKPLLTNFKMIVRTLPDAMYKVKFQDTSSSRIESFNELWKVLMRVIDLDFQSGLKVLRSLSNKFSSEAKKNAFASFLADENGKEYAKIGELLNAFLKNLFVSSHKISSREVSSIDSACNYIRALFDELAYSVGYDTEAISTEITNALVERLTSVLGDKKAAYEKVIKEFITFLMTPDTEKKTKGVDDLISILFAPVNALDNPETFYKQIIKVFAERQDRHDLSKTGVRANPERPVNHFFKQAKAILIEASPDMMDPALNVGGEMYELIKERVQKDGLKDKMQDWAVEFLTAKIVSNPKQVESLIFKRPRPTLISFSMLDEKEKKFKKVLERFGELDSNGKEMDQFWNYLSTQASEPLAAALLAVKPTRVVGYGGEVELDRDGMFASRSSKNDGL